MKAEIDGDGALTKIITVLLPRPVSSGSGQPSRGGRELEGTLILRQFSLRDPSMAENPWAAAVNFDADGVQDITSDAKLVTSAPPPILRPPT